MIDSAIKDHILKVYPFSEDELLTISPFFSKIELGKGVDLLREGSLCNAIYFVESGSLRSFYMKEDGSEVNLHFTFEGEYTTNFMAYLNREPSQVTIQAMEDSIIWQLNPRNYPRPKGSNHPFSTFIRRLAIRLLTATEEHYNMLMMNNPVERYQYILTHKPFLLQKVSLGNLASYLGITRETLSRIRNNKY
ncbi:hypothetical protein A9P82_11020 [Arachidicoccus ginsenosidimutans]|uniref:Crp/Fnr family transcriptional regulator n=1 Tax=Arachidicoccus sp. BS20 TaxID=1850526 RepID=UPI0007F0F369|nr:Crp/Fnr family transcriptional regulator [Arachidicoccus sp. BS20]ANI89772.1 hypothetical protein A9P82_11020 [Arachidicoccus sp. BS20]